MRALSLGLLAILCVTGCSTEKEVVAEKPAYRTPDDGVTIMTFNVENLFDNRDDKKKLDDTYLPRAKKTSAKHRRSCRKIKNKHWRRQFLDRDWNDKVVEEKLKRVGQVIAQAKDGRGADLVILQEVENRRILEKLRKGPLKDLNYRPAILIEGNDVRGIDVAILSRFPLMAKPELHEIPFKDAKKEQKDDTRGILEATFKLPNKKWLTVFALHFPAPFHPRSLRAQAMSYLNVLKRKLPEGRLALAAGDFNIPRAEAKTYKFYEKLMEPDWTVAHTVNCVDCKGTYYFEPKDEWSFLDMILLSKDLTSAEASRGWSLVKDSIRVLTGVKDHVSEEGRPMGFDPEKMQGVSDHWPLVLDLVPSKVGPKSGKDQDKP